jgi:hypothetical protein
VLGDVDETIYVVDEDDEDEEVKVRSRLAADFEMRTNWLLTWARLLVGNPRCSL